MEIGVRHSKKDHAHIRTSTGTGGELSGSESEVPDLDLGKQNRFNCLECYLLEGLSPTNLLAEELFQITAKRKTVY